MIRIVFLLRRKAGLTIDAFHKYWLQEHGPLVASHAKHINAMKYVQVHTLDDPINEAMAKARGGMEPIYDGVAEVWFENRQALVDAMASDAGAKAAAALVADEAKFIDLAASPLWLAHEYPQVNPTPENIVARPRSSFVKLYFPLRRKPGVDLADMQRYWYSNHGPIIRRQAAGSGIARYMQVHRFEDDLEAALRDARGTEVAAYDGHAEVWMDRSITAATTPERKQAGRRAIEDERNFIDFSRSSMWIAKEHVFVDHI
ncbi:MAG: EthD domain-containing protein [Proteobacteria bacterium]|nr:EthD domain-containing protein [Pseudomonadota bacterium]